MAEHTYIEALNMALDEELGRDKTLQVFGEDVGGDKGGVFGVTKELAAKHGDDRVFNTPLAESGIAGLAIGLGLTGIRAVAEFQFADYVLPATNQILSEAARMRYRTGGDWTVPVVFRTPYGGGVRGGFYHSQSIEKIYAGQPGLRIVAPSTPYDAKGMLKAAIRSDDPILFLEHKRCYRLITGEVPETDYTVPLDKANVVREGEDLTVIAYGLALHHAWNAAKELEADGHNVEVVDLRSLYPIDKETLLKSVRKTGKVLLVSEDNKESGLMSEVAASIVEEALFDLDAPIKRLAGPDVPAMGYALAIEQAFLINQDKVKAAMIEMLEY